MRLINKAGLVAGGLTTLLILASCSDSDTSTGVTTGKQLANDSSTQVVMHQGTAGEGEHSNPDTNHGHSPEQQHAEPNNPTTSSVVALLSISNPICGNFSQEDGEQCDGGLSGNATCNTDCTLKTQRGEIIATAVCGNGIVDPGEQCDDANDSNEDDCTRYCKTPVCGDGYVQGSNGEQCDDKNRIDTDGCNNQCQRQQSTAVVTTTTVTEQVNDDGGTTRTTTTPTTPTTTTTNTGGGGSCDNPTWTFAGTLHDVNNGYAANGATPPLWCAWLKNTQGISHQYGTGANSWCLDGQWQSTACGFTDPSSSSAYSSAITSSASSSSSSSSSAAHPAPAAHRVPAPAVAGRLAVAPNTAVAGSTHIHYIPRGMRRAVPGYRLILAVVPTAFATIGGMSPVRWKPQQHRPRQILYVRANTTAVAGDMLAPRSTHGRGSQCGLGGCGMQARSPPLNTTARH